MDDFIKIVDSLEKSGLLIDEGTETVKHEIKKSGRWISWGYDGTYDCFIDINCGFFIGTTWGFFIDKCYIWKRSHESIRTKRGQEGWILLLLALPLMIKVLGKGVTRAGKWKNNMGNMDFLLMTTKYWLLSTLKTNMVKENISINFRLKNIWNKKLSFRWNKK